MAMLSIVSTIKQILPLLRLRPFDISTEEGRTQERYRRVALTTLASVLAKILSITTALISVPLTLHYLGAERYGMWMTMSSLVAMLSFADFGIGSGIVNAIATAHGKDERGAIKEYVSSGIFVLSFIAVVIVALFCALYRVVPWYEIFNVTTNRARDDAAPTLAVLVACFAMAIPLGVVQRVQGGLQKGFTANLWQCLGSVLGLGGVILAIYLEAGLPWLVLAFAGSPLIASLLNSIVYFGWHEPDTAPALKSVSRSATIQIAHIGVLFFVLQIVVALTYTSDNIVIAQILGAKAVAAYAVPQRLFSIISTLLMMMLAPLWPAYGEALARGDHVWIRKTLIRSLLVAGCFSAAVSFVLVLFGSPIIRLWVGNSIAPSFLLLLGLGIWQVFQAGGNAVAMFLNGANVVRFQVVIATALAVLSILFKIILVRWIGLPGVAWATNLAYMITVILPLYFVLPGKLKAIAGRR